MIESRKETSDSLSDKESDSWALKEEDAESDPKELPDSSTDCEADILSEPERLADSD